MGNSNVRSAPGTPTVSPGSERSDSPSERSQTPLYKYHRKSSKTHGATTPTSKRLPTTSNPSSPTETLPGRVPESESQVVNKAGVSPQEVSSSVLHSTPLSSGSSAREGQKPRDSTARLVKEIPKRIQRAVKSPYESLLSHQPAKSRKGLDEQKDRERVPSHVPAENNTNNKLNGLSAESQTGSSAELSSSSGVCVSPGEDESTDDYSSSSWNSALANQDFMKLYWPNQVDREDDPFQRASDNLKEVSTEVSSLHLDLRGLLSRVDSSKRTRLPGQGSPDLSSAYRTHGNSGRDAPLDVLAGESQASLLTMAQNWDSQLFGILQKVTTSLNDLETLKCQNMSLISESILAKSQEHPALRSGTKPGNDDDCDGSFFGSAETTKGIPVMGAGYNPEADARVKSLEAEVGRLQELLAKSEEERLQLEGVWLQAATEHQQEAQRLRTTLREQEARSAELAEQVRTLESEKRKEQGLRTQSGLDYTRLKDSVQQLQQEKGALEQKLSALQEKMQADTAEWRQFQSDLQTAVAVADDFKMEAEEQLVATRDQLVEAQRDAAALRKELKESQARRLGVDTVDTTERSRTLDGRKMPKTLSVAPSVAVNGTSQAKGNSTSAAVVPTIRDNVVKSSSLRNFIAPETESKALTVRDVRRHSSSTRWGELATSPTSPVDSSLLNASDKWPGESETFFRRYGGSKRGIFLQWCQGRTEGYKNVRITNFSTSWADGMALCALLHTYLPEKIPYQRLFPLEKKKNLTLAFDAAENIGIPKTLTTDEMLRPGGPDWQRVLEYVESIHQHFEA